MTITMANDHVTNSSSQPR